jgi:O-antigen biosynthesis protein
MSEGARPDAPRGPAPFAPPDATSRAEARRRWTRYRGEVWLTLAEVRGQRGRLAVLRRLRPGSAPFRLVTGLAAPVFALRRRWRRDVKPGPAARAFPFGDEPVEPATPSPAPTGDVEVIVVDGDDPVPAIARANATLAGEGWILVLDATDQLLDGAVDQLALLGVTASADLVFGDERTRDASGRPVFVARPASPGWVALLSYDVTGRAVLFHRSSLRGIGGFDVAAGWAFRHDAVVRLIESDAVAAHLELSVVETAAEDPRYAAALPAVTSAALARRAGGGRAETDDVTVGLVRWRVRTPDEWPSVSIVLPTRDRLDLLKPCLASLEACTSYPSYEVVIVDNGSVQPETLRFFAETRHRVVAAPGPFNYAAVINRGVAATTGEYVVTLNNDVTIATDDWLEQMVGVASLPRVGVVGVYLEDPAGHAQHEGVAIAPYPQHLRRDRNYLVPDAFLRATREVSAVTGACQLVSRALFDELGGLDESLAIVHNDTDFCLRAQRLGRRVIYVAGVRLLHAESSSRGRLTPTDDIERFIARWDAFGTLRDPWFPTRWELVGDVIRWRQPRRPTAG